MRSDEMVTAAFGAEVTAATGKLATKVCCRHTVHRADCYIAVALRLSFLYY